MSDKPALEPLEGPEPAADAARVPARRVSFVTIVFLFALFASFLLVVDHFYKPAAVAPQNAAAENLAKDLAWKADRTSRRAALAASRARQLGQLSSYAWVDKAKGVVQLPIDRAMELTVAKYGGRK